MSPKPFCDALWKYPVISAILERVNQSPFWGKYWLSILAYSEVANQMQLQNSGSPNNKTSVFIPSDETAIWHLQLPITWDQIDELKLLSVSWFCEHFVAYSCVGSFLSLFCCFSHSPFLLGRNALCFQHFHFTNWSLKCLAAWMIITVK